MLLRHKPEEKTKDFHFSSLLFELEGVSSLAISVTEKVKWSVFVPFKVPSGQLQEGLPLVPFILRLSQTLHVSVEITGHCNTPKQPHIKTYEMNTE